MEHLSAWTAADLHRHLQHALDVEFWTIPLYLTALCSIRGLKELRPDEQPDAAKLIRSVVIQEMLHMEIVCNLCHALGHLPRFDAPTYVHARRIPFIHPAPSALPAHLRGYVCRPGALGEGTLKLFCVIELPHERKPIPWEDRNSYHSIAEMYAALKLGVEHLWERCFVGAGRNDRQKLSFRDYEGVHRGHHGFSQVVDSPGAALKAIDAIVEQGEGADHEHVPADYRPPPLEAGKPFDPGWYRGDLSHYQKFSILLHHRDMLPPVYPVSDDNDAAPRQRELAAAYRNLLEELNASVQAEGDAMRPAFWDRMYAFGDALTAVWEAGACPELELD